jgi:CBS domain-containing protein
MHAPGISQTGTQQGKEMYDQPVRRVMDGAKLLAAPPETTVVEAAKLMAARNVGAVLVVENERLVGIFTERDVVFRVVATGRDANATTIGEAMTADPKTVGPDRSFGYALLLMQQNGFRHVPVVEGEKPVGIVSSRSALDPDMEEFVAEAARRESIR